MFAVDDLRPLFGRSYCADSVMCDPPGTSDVVDSPLTPNFDKHFLDEGLIFRNSYVQVAVCGPSRSSLLTGRRPDSTHINAAPPNSWCWCQRGEFTTFPRHFKNNGYITAGGGKIFHPDGCNRYPDLPGNWLMHPHAGQAPPKTEQAFSHVAAGSMCNTSHIDGDDPGAWTLPYFPHTDTTQGNSADCVQFGVLPCPCIDYPTQCQDPNGDMGPATSQMQHITDLEHPDGKIATWAAETISSWSRDGTGVEGAGKPFFIAVGLHKPHLPHIVPQKYFDLYPDVSKISLPANMNVPKDFPREAWSPSGEIRGYTDAGPEFAQSNFSMTNPPAVSEIRLRRRGYFAATSFTDAQLGRVINALEATGPEIADNTISLLWSDHGWHLGDTNSWFETGARNTMMWHVPKGMYTGFTSRLVEMVDLYPTLVELAGLPVVPKCKGDPAASVHCLHGTSYASAFGVGTALPRAAALHQWPYSVYKADSPTADPWRGPSNPNCAQGLNGTVLPATECPHTMAYAIRTSRFRYIANCEYNLATYTPDWTKVVSQQLYDYEEDPHEFVNLATQPQYAALMKELFAELQEMLEEAR